MGPKESCAKTAAATTSTRKTLGHKKMSTITIETPTKTRITTTKTRITTYGHSGF